MVKKARASQVEFETLLQNALNFIYKKTAHGPRFLFILQRDLAHSIRHLEEMIRISESLIERYEADKQHQEHKHNVPGIKLNQYLISVQKNLIGQRKRLRSGFRLIGDAIAFAMWDSVAIRQFAKHQEPGGYLIDKSDFRHELKLARDLAHVHRRFSLLHELTNSLHFADLTVVTPSGLALVEVKHNPKARYPRELKKLQKQIKRGKYFSELLKRRRIKDEKIWTLAPSQIDPSGTREGTLILPRNKPEEPILKDGTKDDYATEINDLAKEVLKTKRAKFFSPDGIVGYIISTPNEPIPSEGLGEFSKRGHLIAAFLSDRISGHHEIVPFTQFLDPMVSGAIVFGELEIAIMVNDRQLAKYLRKEKLKAPITAREHFLLDGIQYKEFYKGEQIRGRIVLEYPLNHMLYALETPASFARFYRKINESRRSNLEIELKELLRQEMKKKYKKRPQNRKRDKK